MDSESIGISGIFAISIMFTILFDTECLAELVNLLDESPPCSNKYAFLFGGGLSQKARLNIRSRMNFGRARLFGVPPSFLTAEEAR